MYRFHDTPKLLIDRANGSTRSWLAPQIAAAVATAIEQQAQCNLVQLRHQLGPSERNARRVRDVISLLEEYGGMAG